MFAGEPPWCSMNQPSSQMRSAQQAVRFPSDSAPRSQASLAPPVRALSSSSAATLAAALAAASAQSAAPRAQNILSLKTPTQHDPAPKLSIEHASIASGVSTMEGEPSGKSQRITLEDFESVIKEQMSIQSDNLRALLEHRAATASGVSTKENEPSCKSQQILVEHFVSVLKEQMRLQSDNIRALLEHHQNELDIFLARGQLHSKLDLVNGQLEQLLDLFAKKVESPLMERETSYHYMNTCAQPEIKMREDPSRIESFIEKAAKQITEAIDLGVMSIKSSISEHHGDVQSFESVRVALDVLDAPEETNQAVIKEIDRKQSRLSRVDTLDNADHNLTDVLELMTDNTSRKCSCAEQCSGKAIAPHLISVVDNPCFERALTFIILLNTISIAYAADYAVKHPLDPSNGLIFGFEVLFTTFYTFELLIKLAAYGSEFFIGHEWPWNILDAFCVSLSLLDFVVIIAIGESEATGGLNMSFLRVLRLARLTRLFRAFRVMRFFRELRMMIKSITASMRTLLWAQCLLICIGFFFSVLFMNGATNYIQANFDEATFDMCMEWYKPTSSALVVPLPENTPAVCKHSLDLLQSWGSLRVAMLSLVYSVTGAYDWVVVAAPLTDLDGPYFWLFIFYIVFVTMCVLNILIGVYVDTALNANREDKEGNLLDELDQILETDDDFAKIYTLITRSVDEDHDGTISKAELVKAFKSPIIQAYFASMGVKIWNPEDFYSGLQLMTGNVDDDQSLSLQAFVEGCSRSKQVATDSGHAISHKHFATMGKKLDRVERTLRVFIQKLSDVGPRTVRTSWRDCPACGGSGCSVCRPAGTLL